MGLLQYTSNEMFSATELIRRSKKIFDKLNTKEIEKAIILRDGKPGIILLDFNEYEKIMNEYLSLKEKSNKVQIKEKEIVKEKVEEIEHNEFSFDSDLTKEKEEPLKEFWD